MPNCPLCKNSVVRARQLAKPMYFVECLSCGRFHISLEGYEDALPRGLLPGKISAWTRLEHEAGRLAEVTDELLLNPPKIFDGLSVESKIIRALQTIAQKWPVPGANVDWKTNDWPLYCDTGVEEVSWIFNSLKSRNFLETTTVTVEGRILSKKSFLTSKAWAELEAAKTKYQQHNLCLVAMRFLPGLDPLLKAMKRACNRAGYECKTVATDPHADNIDNRLIDLLNRCRFVISDFTDESPNVYFEAGYARGMGKPVIWTRRAGQKVAFDTKQFYFIDWQDSDWAKFESELEISIGAVVGRLAPVG